MSDVSERDQKYLDLIVHRIKVSSLYRPKFGQGSAVSLEAFQTLYGEDAFYSWFGLNNPMLYAAHKAAGGITSLYRQIGIGCERVFREIICDQFGLTHEQSTWAYTIPSSSGKSRTLSLDARIDIENIVSESQRTHFQAWMGEAAQKANVNLSIAHALRGCVFEVRQGYKSKDSKRQNADVANAGSAYAQGYLPVVAMLSNQIDNDVAVRYIQAGWLLLRGTRSLQATESIYTFCASVLQYDLAAFFERHSAYISASVSEVLQSLLKPDDEAVKGAIEAAETVIEDDEFQK